MNITISIESKYKLGDKIYFRSEHKDKEGKILSIYVSNPMTGSFCISNSNNVYDVSYLVDTKNMSCLISENDCSSKPL